MFTEDDVSVEYHIADGFTLYAMTNEYLVHRRYIFYTLEEAMEIFLQEMNEKYYG